MGQLKLAKKRKHRNKPFIQKLNETHISETTEDTEFSLIHKVQTKQTIQLIYNRYIVQNN